LFALDSGYKVGRPRRTPHSLMNDCLWKTSISWLNVADENKLSKAVKNASFDNLYLSKYFINNRDTSQNRAFFNDGFF
jgi:hypothetical protein